ncbi:MAG: hypothetical protein USCAAHI_00204 [Beijerinckiaceae bacterium]|jgi:hypothetical protein|nr:MAG: hypothetical protein USCAAHI_00204 [Beijerinckiaceae bacterium]
MTSPPIEQSLEGWISVLLDYAYTFDCKGRWWFTTIDIVMNHEMALQKFYEASDKSAPIAGGLLSWLPREPDSDGLAPDKIDALLNIQDRCSSKYHGVQRITSSQNRHYFLMCVRDNR